MTVTTQVLRWRRLDDLDLHQIELRNDAATGSLTRQSHASVDLTSLSTIASVTYGVTNRYDVSLIAPFVHTDVATHIEGLTGGGDATSSHSAASRLVLGDVGLRLKAAVIAGSSTGLSVFGKLQAPTARPSDLSGSGRWAEQVGIIAAVRAAGTNVTANAGRRWAGRGIVFEDVTVFGQSFLAVKAVEPSSEWDYNVSVDRPVTTRITVVGELVGRVLDHGARFRVVTRDSPLFGVTSSLEVLPRANQSLLLGSVGAKVQIHSDLLLTVSSTIPISSSGLQSRVAPVVGIAKVF
jgi:hypothetical protein